MRIRSVITGVVVGFTLAVIGAGPALAQSQAKSAPSSGGSSGIDLSANYVIAHPGVNYPAGFAVAVSKPFADVLAVVGEFGLSHKSFGFGFNGNVTTFQGGIRGQMEEDGQKLTPFAQVLVGGQRYSFTGGFTSTNFSVSPGIGVMYAVNKNLKADFQIDYEWAPNNAFFWRWGAGVVIGLGKK